MVNCYIKMFLITRAKVVQMHLVPAWKTTQPCSTHISWRFEVSYKPSSEFRCCDTKARCCYGRVVVDLVLCLFFSVVVVVVVVVFVVVVVAGEDSGETQATVLAGPCLCHGVVLLDLWANFVVT